MRHVRQELRLGATRRFGLFLGDGQLRGALLDTVLQGRVEKSQILLGAFHLGDVAVGLQHLSVAIGFNQQMAARHDDLPAIPGSVAQFSRPKPVARDLRLEALARHRKNGAQQFVTGAAECLLPGIA